jgi:phospholipid/cholesterol/gamma-HCH transport system substrate-binding protein
MKRRNEVTVGILVTVALITLVIGSLWLARGGLSTGYPLYTRFEWGQNLKQGQPVLLAGVSVGYVDKVELRPGYLAVEFRVDDEYKIPRGSLATVKPVGIFGDVAVALTPPKPIPTTFYVPGDTVPPGPSTPDIAQIMSRMDTIGGTVQRLTQAMEADLVAAGGVKDLRRVIGQTSAFAAQLQRVLAEQNRNMTITMASFQNAADRASRLVDSTVVDSVLKNFRTTSANLNRLTLQLDTTASQLNLAMARINAGEGNLGKLARDSTMVLNTQRLLARMDSLVADFMKNPKKYISVSIF